MFKQVKQIGYLKKTKGENGVGFGKRRGGILVTINMGFLVGLAIETLWFNSCMNPDMVTFG